MDASKQNPPRPSILDALETIRRVLLRVKPLAWNRGDTEEYYPAVLTLRKAGYFNQSEFLEWTALPGRPLSDLQEHLSLIESYLESRRLCGGTAPGTGPGNGPEDPPRDAGPENSTLNARAMLLLLDHPDWKLKDFAKALKTHARIFSKPKYAGFREARKALRRQRGLSIPHGSKTKDGNIEAVDE